MMEGWESKVPLNPGPHLRSRVRPLPKPGISEIHVDHPYPTVAWILWCWVGKWGKGSRNPSPPPRAPSWGPPSRDP